MDGSHILLICISVIVSVLTLVVSLYVLISYQHPEDKNQAWFPKLVVVLGISLAILTVLLIPLDVANRKGCTQGLSISDCHLAIPTQQLWYASYIANVVLVFFLIPCTMFYYEADSDK